MPEAVSAAILVGIRNKELTTKIGIMNLAQFDRSKLVGSYVSKEQPSVIDDATMKNGFYGAPSVVAIFGQNNFSFRQADAFCCAENMVRRQPNWVWPPVLFPAALKPLSAPKDSNC